METETKEVVKEQGSKLPSLKKFEVEAVTIRLGGRKLLIGLDKIEEFNKDEKLWEKFQEVVKKSDNNVGVGVLITVAKMQM